MPGTLTASRSAARWNSVPNITIADLKAYQHRVLARDHLTVAIVGDIDAAAAKAMLDRVFGALPAKAQLVSHQVVPPQGLGQRINIDLDVPQTVIDFGGAGIARNDPDFFAAYILNHILGGGTFSSRLSSEIRVKRGLAYSVYDSLVWYDDTALFFGSTATRADSADETVSLIHKEIRDLAENGPTADELAAAKAYLNSSFVLNLDTSAKVASLLAAASARPSRHRLHRHAEAEDRRRDTRRRQARGQAAVWRRHAGYRGRPARRRWPRRAKARRPGPCTRRRRCRRPSAARAATHLR